MKVILAVEKGCIELVDKPKDLEIEIRDYDLSLSYSLSDGMEIKTDSDGRKYHPYPLINPPKPSHAI